MFLLIKEEAEEIAEKQKTDLKTQGLTKVYSKINRVTELQESLLNKINFSVCMFKNRQTPCQFWNDFL